MDQKAHHRTGRVGTARPARGTPNALEGLAGQQQDTLAALLARLGPREELRAFCERVLGRLLEHDRRTGGELVRTLAAYFDAHERVTEAAQLLGAHRNTVLYRLRRVRELSGLDLDDAQQRVEVQFALTIAQSGLYEADTSGGDGHEAGVGR